MLKKKMIMITINVIVMMSYNYKKCYIIVKVVVPRIKTSLENNLKRLKTIISTLQHSASHGMTIILQIVPLFSSQIDLIHNWRAVYQNIRLQEKAKHLIK